MKEPQKQIIENYVHSYNKFDTKGMTRDFAEHVVFENMSNGKVDVRTEGLQEFIEQAETAKQFFKQRKQTIESWEFNESTVLIHIAYEAILNVELPNGLKSGDILKLKGKSKFEFEQGRITKIMDES